VNKELRSRVKHGRTKKIKEGGVKVKGRGVDVAMLEVQRSNLIGEDTAELRLASLTIYGMGMEGWWVVSYGI
jgi:hypothetical protein